MKKKVKPIQKKSTRNAVSTLSTDNIVEAATKRLQELEAVLPILEGACAKKVTERLRILQKKNSFQYYVIPKGDNSNGIYLHAKQISKAATIAQFDYNQKVIDLMKRDVKTLQSFLNSYHPEKYDQAFSTLNPGRKQILNPIRYPDEEYVKRWCDVPYEGLSFHNEHNEYFTDKGIRVRSKSEMIIANKLSKAGVPFRYEAPVIFETPRHIKFHPDFTCLNVRTRKEIIWEHFGIMDDPDYANETLQKIGLFAANGYRLGDNFLATFENGRTTLSLHQVAQYVKMLAE
ncbi:hypothetical protein [Fibrobacter sp. UWEL]|uniref:hypothetical protein n=1 Tax=Fibrobacter sp. UWEL TaxID=1896209 RepID=UPI000911F535|nr:hypothetical protein [Fibrobacter sp. UWEL]SHL36788.1 hypothetical protein SAMN05720468_12415 [Fibrobacter sp. UWEL]